jgi:hypothetical protein
MTLTPLERIWAETDPDSELGMAVDDMLKTAPVPEELPETPTPTESRFGLPPDMTAAIMKGDA